MQGICSCNQVSLSYGRCHTYLGMLMKSHKRTEFSKGRDLIQTTECEPPNCKCSVSLKSCHLKITLKMPYCKWVYTVVITNKK